MSECRQIVSLLPPYVDGEVGPEIAAEVEAHLSACGRCRDQMIAERTAREVLRARAAHLVTPAPPGLRTRLAATLGADRAPSLGWRGRLTACGAAAALVLALVTGFELLSPQSGVLFATQLAIDHIRCFVVELASIDGVDPAEVKREYSRLYGWDVDVPPSSAEEGLTLVAARRCPFWIGDHAHLLYRTGSGEVSLYVTQGDERPSQQLSVLGHRQHIWTAHGDSYALVARGVPEPELARIAAYLEKETATSGSP